MCNEKLYVLYFLSDIFTLMRQLDVDQNGVAYHKTYDLFEY